MRVFAHQRLGFQTDGAITESRAFGATAHNNRCDAVDGSYQRIDLLQVAHFLFYRQK
jgi:hypothetical protein